MTLGIESQTLRIRYISKPPQVCPKPNCECTIFIRHVDGWQCLNCMKIIYRKQLVISSNDTSRDGYHKGSKYSYTETQPIF